MASPNYFSSSNYCFDRIRSSLLKNRVHSGSHSTQMLCESDTYGIFKWEVQNPDFCRNGIKSATLFKRTNSFYQGKGEEISKTRERNSVLCSSSSK